MRSSSRRVIPAGLQKSSLLNGLVAYWPLNEAMGAGGAADLAGGYDLAYTAGTPALTVNAGNTYQLAREITPWTETGYARLSVNNASVRLATTHTWATWLLAYSDTPYSAPHLYNIPWSWIDGNGGEALLLTTSSALAYQAGAGAGGADNRSLHTTIPGTLLNTWHLSICEYDHDTQTYKQLIDNANETVDIATGKTFRVGSAVPLSVGGGTLQSWDGLIGPVMYWNRLLTAQEKAQLWNDGRGWKFDGMRSLPPQPFTPPAWSRPPGAPYAKAIYVPKGAASLAASYVNQASATGLYNATSSAEPMLTAAGWSLNGSSQWVNVPNISTLFTGEDKPIVVMWRATKASTSTWGDVFALAKSNNSNPFFLARMSNAAKIQSTRRDDSSSQVVVASAGSYTTDDAVFAIVHTGSQTTIYFDGVADAEPSAQNVGTSTFDQASIGVTNYGGSLVNYFGGVISAVAIWDDVTDAATWVPTVMANMAAL